MDASIAKSTVGHVPKTKKNRFYFNKQKIRCQKSDTTTIATNFIDAVNRSCCYTRACGLLRLSSKKGLEPKPISIYLFLLSHMLINHSNLIENNEFIIREALLFD